MEVWKDIKGYEGVYQVSNYGRVKSLSRIVNNNGATYIMKERILKPGLVGPKRRQYYAVCLHKDGKNKTTKNHQLVGLYFVDNPHNLPVLNHKDNDPLNNYASNLEWTTNRDNVTHGYNLKKTSSEYPGVCWKKRAQKWVAQIQINGKNKQIGLFDCEQEAAQTYQNALKNIAV